MRRRAATVGLILSALSMAGCIDQTVRIDPAPAPAPGGRNATLAVVINTRPHDDQTAFTMTKHLPVMVSVDAVRHDPVGLSRYDAVITNPLVWWQRFPCDIAADLLPIRYTSLTTATIAYQPVPACDEAALTSEAIAHGFAHPHAH